MDKKYTGHYRIITEEQNIFEKQITGETYTRDYWLKLYAGMALQGILVDTNVSIDQAVNIATEAATKLANKMFKENKNDNK